MLTMMVIVMILLTKYVNNDDENDGAKSYDDAQNYQNYENYDENAQNGDDDDDAQEKGSEGASYGPAHITGFRCYCHQNWGRGITYDGDALDPPKNNRGEI